MSTDLTRAANASPHVAAVHRSARHAFTKHAEACITLLAGLGVEGDAHCGHTVQNRYLKRLDSSRPNLRQVHLLQAELLDELRTQGFEVSAGGLGENISTRGLDMLSLARGTRLHIGADAIVELTGLRAPCVQIDRFRNGLKAQVTTRDARGASIIKAGVMGIVLRGGAICGDDVIVVRPPDGPHAPLEPV